MHQLPANKVVRWLVGGFIGTLLVACYQLSGYLDQPLLNYKHFFHSQVLDLATEINRIRFRLTLISKLFLKMR